MPEAIDTDDATSLSERIVRKIVAETDAELPGPEPLYDRVDPDGLERLFSGGSSRADRTRGYVTFPVADCWVTVHADETIVVEPDAPNADPSPRAGGNPSSSYVAE